MEIKEILTTQADELLDIDIDVLNEELDTGCYTHAYKKECKALIDAIARKRALTHSSKSAQVIEPDMQPTVRTLHPSALSPYSKPDERGEERGGNLECDLAAIRKSSKKASEFKAYIESHPFINEDYIDANFSLFEPQERSALLGMRKFSEPFLEKYFDSLDHNALAKHQEFSEGFFMSHFSDLDPRIVLEDGINTWRDKDSRSSKLDVFLRLKGVRL